MKKAQIQVGETYIAKVSGVLTTVRVTGESPYGGWDAVNTRTGRSVRVRSAARLRRACLGRCLATRVPTTAPPSPSQKAEGIVRDFETDDSGTTCVDVHAATVSNVGSSVLNPLRF